MSPPPRCLPGWRASAAGNFPATRARPEIHDLLEREYARAARLRAHSDALVGAADDVLDTLTARLVALVGLLDGRHALIRPSGPHGARGGEREARALRP